jgi:hypothetical protein
MGAADLGSDPGGFAHQNFTGMIVDAIGRDARPQPKTRVYVESPNMRKASTLRKGQKRSGKGVLNPTFCRDCRREPSGQRCACFA